MFSVRAARAPLGIGISLFTILALSGGCSGDSNATGQRVEVNQDAQDAVQGAMRAHMKDQAKSKDPRSHSVQR